MHRILGKCDTRSLQRAQDFKKVYCTIDPVYGNNLLGEKKRLLYLQQSLYFQSSIKNNSHLLIQTTRRQGSRLSVVAARVSYNSQLLKRFIYIRQSHGKYCKEAVNGIIKQNAHICDCTFTCDGTSSLCITIHNSINQSLTKYFSSTTLNDNNKTTIKKSINEIIFNNQKVVKPNLSLTNQTNYTNFAIKLFDRNHLKNIPRIQTTLISRNSSSSSVIQQIKPKTESKDSDGKTAEMTTSKPAGKEFQRLPKNVIPTHYELQLKPNLQAFTFEGNTNIHLQVATATNVITLNAASLTIKNAELEICEEVLKSKSIDYSNENETISFVFENDLPLCKNATLKLTFDGELNDKMKGFYRSKYFTEKGEERYAGVTQFEATDARRCFPCWDEPAIKATFDVQVIVPEGRIALSNMPIIKEQLLESGLKCVTFDRTPIMSTYLVAVVVGEYDYVEGKSEDGVIVRVFTPLGKKEQGLFALEVATKVLPYYKSYFNIAYPLPKMDLIAISDFSAGAMENWGLVTYRETFVLVDPKNTSIMRKQSIALTVGHEIAHQWFGNLVTMEWWTHLWLNEGYASFVEFLCVNHLFPEYDIWTQFVTDMYTRALELDCLKNSHPIEVPVNHPYEIDEIFDEISYNKGASIIRMLHDYIGEADFRKGMNIYLTRHQYKNTCTEDLWAALQEASSKPVTEVMSTWIKLKGFPAVSVDSKELEGNKRLLHLTQRKFTADGLKSDENSLWVIPITVSTSKEPKGISKTFLLKGESMDVVIDNVGPNDWIKINPGTVGYYRTRYSKEMLGKLIPAVSNMELPPLDRLGLIDDMFAMVQAGHTSTAEVLKLIDSYRNETNYTVWTAITNSLSNLYMLITHTNLMEDFNKYGEKLYRPVAERLGWDACDGENHMDKLLRSLVLSRLVSYRCHEIVSEGKKRFRDHVNKVSILPADLRSTCYKAVLQNADNTIFEEMLSLYRATDLHEEQDRISRALGCIEDVDLLKKVIDFAMSGEVRAQDSVFVIVAVAGNPKGRDMAWQFFKDNHQKLQKQYEGGFLLSRLVKYLIENFATEERALEVEEFFKTHDFPGTERTVLQAVETIRLNAAWLKRDLDAITVYLKKQNQ